MTVKYFKEIDIYFHMKNHYRKLRNVKSSIDGSAPVGFTKSGTSTVSLSDRSLKTSSGTCKERPLKKSPRVPHAGSKKQNGTSAATTMSDSSMSPPKEPPGPPRPITRRHPNEMPQKLQGSVRSQSEELYFRRDSHLFHGYSYAKPKKKRGGSTRRNQDDKERLLLDPTKICSTTRQLNIKAAKNAKNNKKCLSKKSDKSTVVKNRTEEHEYLHFLLRITEDIILNNYITNEDIEKVFHRHIEANRERLNMEKMLDQVARLCQEINIPYEKCADRLQKLAATYLETTDDISFDVEDNPDFRNCQCSIMRSLEKAVKTWQSRPKLTVDLNESSHQDLSNDNDLGQENGLDNELLAPKHSLGRVTECTEPSISRDTIVNSTKNPSDVTVSSFGNVEVLPCFEQQSCGDSGNGSRNLFTQELMRDVTEAQNGSKEMPLTEKEKFEALQEKILFHKINNKFTNESNSTVLPAPTKETEEANLINYGASQESDVFFQQLQQVYNMEINAARFPSNVPVKSAASHCESVLKFSGDLELKSVHSTVTNASFFLKPNESIQVSQLAGETEAKDIGHGDAIKEVKSFFLNPKSTCNDVTLNSDDEKTGSVNGEDLSFFFNHNSFSDMVIAPPENEVQESASFFLNRRDDFSNTEVKNFENKESLDFFFKHKDPSSENAFENPPATTKEAVSFFFKQKLDISSQTSATTKESDSFFLRPKNNAAIDIDVAKVPSVADKESNSFFLKLKDTISNVIEITKSPTTLYGASHMDVTNFVKHDEDAPESQKCQSFFLIVRDSTGNVSEDAKIPNEQEAELVLSSYRESEVNSSIMEQREEHFEKVIDEEFELENDVLETEEDYATILKESAESGFLQPCDSTSYRIANTSSGEAFNMQGSSEDNNDTNVNDDEAETTRSYRTNNVTTSDKHTQISTSCADKECNTDPMVELKKYVSYNNDYVLMNGPLYVLKSVLDDRQNLVMCEEEIASPKKLAIESPKYTSWINLGNPHSDPFYFGQTKGSSKLLNTDYDLTPQRDENSSSICNGFLAGNTTPTSRTLLQKMNSGESLLLNDDYTVSKDVQSQATFLENKVAQTTKEYIVLNNELSADGRYEISTYNLPTEKSKAGNHTYTVNSPTGDGGHIFLDDYNLTSDRSESDGVGDGGAGLDEITEKLTELSMSLADFRVNFQNCARKETEACAENSSETGTEVSDTETSKFTGADEISLSSFRSENVLYLSGNHKVLLGKRKFNHSE